MNNQENKNPLSIRSSSEQKKTTSLAVFEGLTDYLFDGISIVTLPFSETKEIVIKGVDGVSVSGAESTSDFLLPVENDVTSTTTYWATSRITNTSFGKFLSVDKPSRFRCSFYLQNALNLDGYILSPAVYDSSASLNSFTSPSILRGYVGLKFLRGKVFVAVKEAGKSEKLRELPLRITNETTYRLDMKTGAKNTEIYIDSILQGVYSTDFTTGFGTPESFIPFLSCAKSTTTGQAVTITVENLLFVQQN